MARLSRIEVFSATEVAIVHVMNRVVRRCFLLGDDPVSGQNYDHRKQWIEELLRRFAANFGIDLLGFAILSNHFHLILRSRPECCGNLGRHRSRQTLADALPVAQGGRSSTGRAE